MPKSGTAARAALLGSTYAGLSLAVTVVTAFGGSSGTTFWPAAGVTLAFLLLRPRSEWPWLLAAVWIAEFTLNYWVSHITFPVSAGWAFANTVEPLVAAALLTMGGRGTPDLARRGHLFRFIVIGVLTGPSVGALVGVGSGALADFYPMWPAYPRWFVGDAVGALVLTPMLLSFSPRSAARNAPNPLIAGYLIVLGLVAAATMAPWNVAWDNALPYLLAPFLAFIALRLGPRGAALGVAVVALAVNAFTAAGAGPFASPDTIGGLIEAQSFVATTAVMAFIVAALTNDLVGRDEVDQAKNAFIQTVAHDLRNPLGVIRGFAETLEEHGDSLAPEQRALILERMSATTDRLIGLVGDILDLQRLNDGAVEARREPTDLASLVRDLVDGIAGDGRPIHLGDGTVIAAVDPLHAGRIYENLIVNAMRHTPKGTPIWVSAEPRSNGVVLVVEDAGPGIPDQRKGSIFSPFEKGKQGDPGTGVGLALVARFAALHGGRAWVEDRDGGGASFKVFLSSTSR